LIGFYARKKERNDKKKTIVPKLLYSVIRIIDCQLKNHWVKCKNLSFKNLKDILNDIQF
jgi:hypothetical protein